MSNLNQIIETITVVGTLALLILGIAQRVLKAMKPGTKRNAAQFIVSLAETAVRDGMQEANKIKSLPGPNDSVALEKLKTKAEHFVNEYGARELDVVLDGHSDKRAAVAEFVSKAVEAQVQIAKSPPPVVVVPEPTTPVEPCPPGEPKDPE